MGNKASQLEEENKFFIYRRSNHFSNLEKLKAQGALCDITIEVEDKQFRAHKLILAASINYFDTVFISEKCTIDKIPIPNVTATNMESIINFAYSGEISLTEENVQSLMKDVDTLGIIDVKNECVKFLESRLHPRNVFDVYHLATELSCIPLKEKSDKIMRQYFIDAAEADKYFDLDFVVLKDILSNIDLKIIPQTKLFEAIMKWVKHDFDERQDHLVNLLVYVNFSEVSPDYLIDYFCRPELIASTRDYNFLMKNVMSYYHKIKTQVQEDFTIVERENYTGTGSGHICVISTVHKNFIESYDLRANLWKSIDSIEDPIVWFCSIVHEDKLFVIGGQKQWEIIPTVKVYFFHSQIWDTLTPMNTKRCWAGATILNGYLYACGGEDGKNFLNSVERYCFEINEWKTISSMKHQRSRPIVVTLQGYIYAFGGYDKISALHSAERYDPWKNQWTIVEMKMNQKRSSFGAAVLNEKLYVCGGMSNEHNVDTLNSVECYDPSTNKWENVASMKNARHSLLLVAAGEKLWAIGGVDKKGLPVSTVEVYDPNTDSWTHASSMNSIRGRVAGGVLSVL